MNRLSTEERFGISVRSYELIQETLRNHAEVERAIIFGSRAMGEAKRGSDIDLAIEGAEVTRATAEELSRELNERVPIPYYVDVVAYDRAEEGALKEHIDSEGREFFRRGTA